MVYHENVSLKYFYDCFRECNRRGDVLGVVNDFYMGLYLVWKSEILVDTIMVYVENVSLKYFYDCFRECNRRGDVLGVVNDFYMGLYLVWKSGY